MTPLRADPKQDLDHRIPQDPRLRRFGRVVLSRCERMLIHRLLSASWHRYCLPFTVPRADVGEVETALGVHVSLARLHTQLGSAAAPPVRVRVKPNPRALIPFTVFEGL